MVFGAVVASNPNPAFVLILAGGIRDRADSTSVTSTWAGSLSPARAITPAITFSLRPALARVGVPLATDDQLVGGGQNVYALPSQKEGIHNVGRDAGREAGGRAVL